MNKCHDSPTMLFEDFALVLSARYTKAARAEVGPAFSGD